MPERPLPAGIALCVLALATAAVAGYASGFAPALLVPALLVPAQAVAGLGVGLLRGTRPVSGRLPVSAMHLVLAWSLLALAAAATIAWPSRRLLAQPSLAHALLLAGGVGVLLVVAWTQWRRLVELESGLAPAGASDDWRGLFSVALPAVGVTAGAVALSWPLPGVGVAMRMALASGFGMLSLLAHWFMQVPVPRVHRRATEPQGRASRRAGSPPVGAALPVIEMTSVEAPTDGVLTGAAKPARGTSSDAGSVDGAAAGAEPAASARDDAAIPVRGDAELDRHLHAAARNGRVEQALALLQAGADPAAAPDPAQRDRRSLPVLAALLPDLRLLRALIQRGVDVNGMHAGMTPLLATTRDSWHGRPEAVMTLLANGADPRLADAAGCTPLHHAARSADPGVAALLCDAGAGLDALDREGASPLAAACAVGNWRLARFLLERGARCEPDGGEPALVAAAGGEEDDTAGVLLLLRHKARVDARDRAGRSALHAAAAASHVSIANALIGASAKVDADDGAGRTALHEAAAAGALAVVDVLLGAGADVHAADRDGATALHALAASPTPSLHVAQRLLEAGARADAPDGAGSSAVDLARRAGQRSLLEILDPERAAAASGPAAPRLPPPLQLREHLLAGAPDATARAVLAQLEHGELDRMLGDADVVASPPRLRWLLRAGARPDAWGVVPSPVAAALARGSNGIEALEALFAHGGSPSGRGGLAAFIGACLASGPKPAAERFALDLLARGADPFAPATDAATPLLLATRARWAHLQRALLEAGVDPNTADRRGATALHAAVEGDDLAAVQALLRQGAAPDQRAADGQTPLGLALSAGKRDLAAWLDWRAWPLPRRALQPFDLPVAAMRGDVGTVRRLLALGLPVDARDHQGCTALLRASGGGHLAIVDALLDAGADPRLAASTGATPLSAAISMRHLGVLDRLLALRAGIEDRLPGGVSALMLAAALGLPEAVSRLIGAGADLAATDAQGLTPLHCAALYGFTARDRSRLLALLDGLLLAGADADAAAGGGLTPLLLLVGARADVGTAVSEDVLLAGLERLIDEGVRLDVRDGRGFNPLHLAALHGLQRCLRLLLAAGADPAARDAQGRSPRDVAMARGFVEIAADLGPAAAAASPPSPAGGVSLARFLKE